MRIERHRSGSVGAHEAMKIVKKSVAEINNTCTPPRAYDTSSLSNSLFPILYVKKMATHIKYVHEELFFFLTMFILFIVKKWVNISQTNNLLHPFSS